MEVANASMYDGPTACAEAVQMANRVTGRNRAVVAGHLHPHYRETIETMAHLTDFSVETGMPQPTGQQNLEDLIDEETSCVVVQTPDFFGRLHDFTHLAKACENAGALLIVVVTEVVSLGLLKPPGAMGADIVVAEGQGIGNGLNFGGPYVGLFACKEKYIRQMPGRLCGQTVDAEGRRGFVLTLSTREQHIRREKATSNICTNSGLCALGFTIHMSLLGEAGLTQLAELNHAKATRLADRLSSISGVKVLNETFFNEFTVQLPKPAAAVVDQLAAKPILGGVAVSRFYPGDKSLANLLLVTATELTTEGDMEIFAKALQEACK
jgi:glycine dehydrogenase subunit 1